MIKKLCALPLLRRTYDINVSYIIPLNRDGNILGYEKDTISLQLTLFSPQPQTSMHAKHNRSLPTIVMR